MGRIKGRTTSESQHLNLKRKNGFPPGISLADYALKDYIPELEEKIKFIMETTEESPKNTTLYKRVPMPIFDNKEEEGYYHREEIRRCVDGHNGMSGKMYFWFNYCKIKSPTGKIYPEYRVADQEWFDLLDSAEKSHKYGIICVKRRRAGFSWKEAADSLHDVSFNSYYNVGMNSKSEKDSIELFSKVRFLYDNLPQFLRATSTAHNTKSGMHFSYRQKDALGNIVTKGNQSEIIVVAPTPSAYEGLMLQKWVADEAGKVQHLSQLWAYTEPCLMQETARVGCPILFGTAGEIAKEGRDFKELWDNSAVHNLHRFFFAGWMGIFVDGFGNDMKEESVRWIFYERYKRRNIDPKKLNDFIQQYPLTIEEAFSMSNGAGVGNLMNINKQISSLRENPPLKVRGRFKWNNVGDGVIWVPDSAGECIVYKQPNKDLQNGYISGCDPADHDDVTDEASDLSMFIASRQDGLSEPEIVFEYTARPKKLNHYYEQAAMALIYYGNAKMLIENNRYRMISYFEDNNYKSLLSPAPQGIIRRFFTSRINNIGVRMTDSVKEYMEGLIDEYTDDYCDLIPSLTLLEEFIKYKSVNTDRVMAFGVMLMNLREVSKRKVYNSGTKKSILPSFKYIKGANGKIKRV